MFYVYVNGPQGSDVRKVETETFTVGRSDESDLVVAHETLSRRHLVIRQRGGDIFVEDLGSANGTFVNEEKIPARAPIRLDPEDRVAMGEAEVNLSVTADLPTVILPPVSTRAKSPRPAVDPHAVTRLKVEAPRKAASAPAPAPVPAAVAVAPVQDAAIAFEDEAPADLPRSKNWPRLAAAFGVVAVVAVAAVGGLAYRHFGQPAEIPAARQVAALPPPIVTAPKVYRGSYVDNVLATPKFIETYLCDEFQSRLNRELVPRAARVWHVDPNQITQALGITAELVKTLGEVRGDGTPPAEQMETMRRLEADADLQLTEVLGARDRALGFRAFEKSLFEH